MSRSQFTAYAAALALGAFAPRLMAQDTSSTTPTRPDTSGYTTGAGSVDTSARPGSVGVTDTAVGGAADSSTSAGGAVTDSLPPAGDTSGMPSRLPADSTKPSSATSPGTESNGSTESGGSTKPSP
jgi:hypothetical protein